MILYFGDWHGEPPLVSQIYSERVLTSRVPLLLRGKLARITGIELYIFGMSARGNHAGLTPQPLLPVRARLSCSAWPGPMSEVGPKAEKARYEHMYDLSAL